MAVTLVAGGCQSSEPSAESLIGLHLSQAEDIAEGGLQVYDLTTRLTTTADEYDPNEEEAKGRWTVVGVCSPSGDARGKDTSVGIIPAAEYKGAIEAKAKAGGYDYLIAECQK
ncbi:hypothetical protein [Aeromicrobium sp.]|uniref:hypothetical protein n=1 Tax=Aeromicrobium sp. TaxID=1871063 RepID=UPI0030C0E6C3